MNTQPPNWEQKAIERIALEGIKEQKRSRRWGIFFKILFFLYLIIITVSIFDTIEDNYEYDSLGQKLSSIENENHIALLKIEGVIAAYEKANSEDINAILQQIMSNDNIKGLLLSVNSPGGSPVQASEIYKTIRSLKEKYKKPILTYVSDSCTSGCYYIVSATDEIYADKSSIIGSIGVIFNSFGYAEIAKKLGIDPRTFTAGENKDFMNPSRPVTEKEKKHLKYVLDAIHNNFITAVKNGRKERLVDNKEIFSGLFWLSDRAKDLGLIDGFATPLEVAKKIGDYPVYDYSIQNPIDNILENIGGATQNTISNALNKVFSKPNLVEFK